MIPIGTDAPRRRTPWMNWAIIALCFVIYLISHPDNPSAHYLGVNSGWGKFLLWRQHLHLYQFVTYLFLHASIMHILGNMLFLWVFGDVVNERLGHIPYLLFFLAGGIFAGVGQVLTSGAPTLGASGAIAAVAGMFLVLAPMTNIRVWFFFFIFKVPSLLFVIFEIVTFDLAGEIFPGRNDNVAHFAHLTGYTTGFTVGIILLAMRLVPRDQSDLLALINRLRRRHVYRSMVAAGFNPFATAPQGGNIVRPDGPMPLRPDDPDYLRCQELRNRITELRRDHLLPEAANVYLELKKLDPAQVLSAQIQLDIANQLMAAGHYPQAADAYEDYLKYYGTGANCDQVQLVLALIYARYFINRNRAIDLFQKALPKLHDGTQRELAQKELAALKAIGA